ncbi:MAG: prepilin-type N-terminal cleavage/methylation domain-containing protein, partial [Campylobacterota bacterium]|nr:prepilin-type N-terminal cleavage/methylation domain-containing protein [Campylobacterota bacterium]
MNSNIKNKYAFTMLELVFVIVILGIVASIGAQVIAKTYEAY